MPAFNTNNGKKNNATNGWQTAKLGDLCDILIGGTPRRDNRTFWGGTNPWVAISDLNDDVITVTKEQITDDGIKRSNVKLVKTGTLLLSFKLTIGKMAIAGRDLYTNEAIAALPVKDTSKLLPEFLPIALNAATLTGRAQEASKGLTLNKEKLKQIQLCFPVDHSKQRRIINLVNSEQQKAKVAIRQHNSLSEDFRDLLFGLYNRITQDVDWKPMGEVCPLIRRAVAIDPQAEYPELGIRSFGKGTFHKAALRGEYVGTKRLYKIHAGDLVFHNVFGWEGAIAVVNPEDDGRFGSHRFITCTPKPNVMTAPFLYFHFTTEKGLHDIGDASPGGADRNRTLGLTALQKIKVPMAKLYRPNNVQQALGFSTRIRDYTEGSQKPSITPYSRSDL